MSSSYLSACGARIYPALSVLPLDSLLPQKLIQETIKPTLKPQCQCNPSRVCHKVCQIEKDPANSVTELRSLTFVARGRV